MDSFVNVPDYGHGGWKVIVVAVLLIVMQLIMLCGRFASRRLQKVSLGADDYILTLSTIFTVGLCALAIAFPRIAGIGSDVTGPETLPRSSSNRQIFMAWMIIYGLSIALSKCAILLLYVRVFTTCKRLFTITACIVGLVIAATAIANTSLAIFQCRPQSFAWDKSIEGGTCIDVIAWARYIAIPNVVTGVIMFVMPLPIVWKLNVNVSAKIALTATFLHGIIGFVASFARLSILFSTNTTPISSHTSLIWTIWTINEPANYIIAACLPTLRPLFIRILPASFFILSHHRPPKPYNPSSLKVSWPKGSLAPKFHLETKRFQTSSRITGPWDTAHGWEADGGDEYWGDVEGERVGGGSGQRVGVGMLAPVRAEKKGLVVNAREVSEKEHL